jgi:hypothetical protein
MSRPLTPEDFETIKKQWQKEVRARILTATLTPSDSPDILELIDQVLLAVGSERRLSLLLDLIKAPSVPYLLAGLPEVVGRLR